MSIKKLIPISSSTKLTHLEEKSSTEDVDLGNNISRMNTWSDENVVMIKNSICYHVSLLKQNLFDKCQANSLKRRARRLSRQDLIDKINRFCIELDNQKDGIIRGITDLACILEINRWSAELDQNENAEIYLFLDLMMEHCFHMIEWSNDPYTMLTSDRNILRKEFKPIEFSSFQIRSENNFQETKSNEICPVIENTKLKEISSVITQDEDYDNRNTRLIQLANKIDATRWHVDLPSLKNSEFKKSFHACRLSAMIRFNVKRNTLVLDTELLFDRLGCD